MRFSNKILPMLCALLLLLSVCIGTIACGDADPANTTTDATTTASTTTTSTTTTVPNQEEPEPAKATFTFKVTHADGTVKIFEVKTNAETVGAALLAEGLIEGEAGDYGLYVKIVDGETADYNVDQSYWAFYIGDAMAEIGVDSTPVTDGGVYSFVYTK